MVGVSVRSISFEIIENVNGVIRINRNGIQDQPTVLKNFLGPQFKSFSGKLECFDTTEHLHPSLIFPKRARSLNS